MKSSVLFAGDLEEMKQALERMQCQWDMVFVKDGQDAIEALNNSAFDVVVADSNVPGITSVDFFSRISEEYPNVIRMLLLATDGQISPMESAIPAHQVLPKTCEPDLLEAKVARAFALRRILTNEALTSCISKMRALPSPPTLYFDIMKELASGNDKTMTRIGELIAKDIGMTAKILSVVNSAHFGLRVRASNPVHAAKMLGPTTIKALVLSCEVFSKFSHIQLPGTTFEELLNHSQIVGSFAKRIAELEGADKSTVEDAFLAGILHDTGKLIFASNFQDQYASLAETASENDISIWQAEQDAFGATHAEMGAYLMGLWGMSDSIVEALAFHHQAGRSFDANFGIITAVHVANALEHELHEEFETVAPVVDEDYLARLSMSERLSVWRESCHENMLQAAA